MCFAIEYEHFRHNAYFSTYKFMNGEAGYKIDNHTMDFYLTMLAAGITEDMLFSHPNGQYRAAENKACSVLYTFQFPKWIAAVYKNRYKFAADIILKCEKDKRSFFCMRGFEYIIGSKNADFIDEFTDNGRNEYYIKIMLNIMVQDYLRGGKSLFKYIKRYCPNKKLSDGEYLDRALLALNDPDLLFDSICSETAYIIHSCEYGKYMSCESAEKYNRRAAQLMCRCAELGMKMKKFKSFKYMFISWESAFESNMEIPLQLAELIGSKTSVYGCAYVDMERDFYECLARFMPVYFKNTASGASEPFEELEYIGMRFKEKYGCKLKIKADIGDLETLDERYADIIEFDLSSYILSKICRDKKALKIIIEKNFLSGNDIETLIKYCIEDFEENKNKQALLTLRELNDALSKASS